jgi:hypothetical protein
MQRLYLENQNTVERMLHKDYNHKCSVEKKNTGRGSPEAWHQGEPI